MLMSCNKYFAYKYHVITALKRRLKASHWYGTPFLYLIAAKSLVLQYCLTIQVGRNHKMDMIASYSHVISPAVTEDEILL